MTHLIGIDLGTQGTKAVLRNENGTPVAEAFEPSNLIQPELGSIEQNPEEILDSVTRTISETMDKSGVPPKDIAALCLSGQMAGIMGVDKNGMAATPYDSWLDTRCGKYRDAIIEKGERRVIELTGAPVTYAHGPKILWWKNERPETYRQIHKFTQPAAYVAMRLCGLSGDDAFIDHTYLHFSGFADTANRKWSPELLELLDVPADKMPRIVKPEKRIGGLTTKMAIRCGLAEGTPVVAGCGDTAASIFGAGVTDSGRFLDVAGTASVLACCLGTFAPDTEHKTIMFPNSVVEGLFTPMAYINGGGMCLKWFRDDVLNGKLGFDDLNRLADEITPGSDDLFFLPHFSGRVCPNDTLVRGSFVNLGWRHNRAHMYRSILEGIAYEYGIYKDIIRELVPDAEFKDVVSVGGGSKSRLFTQIKSDVLGIPVETINLSDTALLACCSIAGYGVGLYSSVDELINSCVKKLDGVTPDMERHESYRPRQDIYAKIIPSLWGVYSDIEKLRR